MLAIVAAAILAASDGAMPADPLARCSVAIHGGLLDAEAACARPKAANVIWRDDDLTFACGDALDYGRALAKTARGMPEQTVVELVKGYDRRAAICHGATEPAGDQHTAHDPWK